MKFKFFAVLLAIFASLNFANADEVSEYAEYDFERFYVSPQVVAVMPQGGGDVRHMVGGGVKLGYYYGDFLSFEASTSLLEDNTGFSLGALWHWWGYEKFDPFFTFGVNGWIDGEVGPYIGWGTFWHINDLWSLRLDTSSTFGIDSKDEVVFSVAFGIQYSF